MTTAAPRSETEARNASVVEAFCADWDRLDLEAALGKMTDDCIYHNLPAAPLEGKAAIRAFMAPYFETVERCRFDIRTLIAEGDVVMAERVDRFDLPGGVHIDIPVTGVFELTADGLIRAWREYWDLATWLRQGGPPLEGGGQ